MFKYQRPFRKGAKTDNEFASLWVKEIFYFTEDMFPTIHRRTLVVDYGEEELSPIDNAISSIETKNDELPLVLPVRPPCEFRQWSEPFLLVDVARESNHFL